MTSSAASFVHFSDDYSAVFQLLNFAAMKSRFMRAMKSTEISFGHTASHSRNIVQLPNIDSMTSTIRRTRS